MFKKIIPIILILFFVFGCCSLSQAVGIDPVGTPGAITMQSGEEAIAETIGLIIKICIGIVGAVALGIFVYGGVIWVSAMGNAEKVTRGKNLFVWATIGLVVVIFGYVITDFIIYALTGGLAAPEREPFGPTACNDDKDNDCDGLVDFGTGPKNDPGCSNLFDEDEYNVPAPDTCDGTCYRKTPGSIEKCEDVPRSRAQQQLVDGTGDCKATALNTCTTSPARVDPNTGNCIPATMSCSAADFICCKEPPPPPICGGSANVPSGVGTHTQTVDMYVQKGKLGVAWHFQIIPDKLNIYCNGETDPFFTTEYRQCAGTYLVDFDCASTTELIFEVVSIDKSNTQWCFNIVCDPTGTIPNNCTGYKCPPDPCNNKYCSWTAPACPAGIQCPPP